MRIFKTLEEKVAVEKKYLPLIHKELEKLNAAIAQQSHDAKGSMNDLTGVMKDQAGKMGQFIEVIRHFFAIERTLRDAEAKRKAEQEDATKTTEFDLKF